MNSRPVRIVLLVLVAFLAALVWRRESTEPRALSSVTQSSAREAPRREVVRSRGTQTTQRDAGRVAESSARLPEISASSGAETWWRAHPQAVTLHRRNGDAVVFQHSKETRDGEIVTWVGRSAAMPDALLVSVARPGDYTAVALLPSEPQRSMRVHDGVMTVEEVLASGQDCDLAVAPPRVESAPDGVSLVKPTDPTTTGGVAAASVTQNVDVLFLYNTRALGIAAERSSDPVGYIDGYARAALATANEVLQNSRIDAFRWRYVGLAAVPEYPVKQTVSEDLQMIAPDGPYAELVATERARYGADQVLMWTGAGVRQGSAYGGLIRNQPVERGGMVAALRLTAGVLILAHELAHNFGCHHDRGHAGSGDGSTAQPEGDGNWCYGLLWSDGAGTTGTVMAYADSLVPYFSHPQIRVGDHVIGYAETDPRAAFNSRIMTDFAEYIATETPETEATPVILQQPRDTAGTEGQAVTLSVSAVGGGLRYQWMKAGVAIEGASSAELARTVGASVTGDYSVVVSNSRGSVTSRSAQLTLNTPAAPTPSNPTTPAASSAGGGGGGGGGSASVWSLLALATLLAMRRTPRS